MPMDDERGMEEEFILDTTDFNESFEPELLAEGDEAEVRVVSARAQPKKDGVGYVLAMRLEVTGNPRADDIYHYLRLPDTAMKAENLKGWNRSVKSLERVAACFGVGMDTGRLNFRDFEGQTGWILTRIEDDPTYGKKNVIREFVVQR